jgi:hypothetical protein
MLKKVFKLFLIYVYYIHRLYMIVFVDRMVYTVSVCQCHDTLNTGIVAFIPDVIVIMFVMIEV